MSTMCRVGYHFFTPKSSKGRLVSLLGISPVSHIVLSIHPEEGKSHYYECGWGMKSTWYVGEMGVVPYDSLYEDLEIDLKELNNILPSNQPYNSTKVTFNLILGVYKESPSCVSCVHKVRWLANKVTKGRTPGGIYREIKRLQDR